MTDGIATLTTAMSSSTQVMIQNWKVGDLVVATDTDFGITKGKTYKILKRGFFYDCFFIKDDSGEEVEYSQDYFELVINGGNNL